MNEKMNGSLQARVLEQGVNAFSVSHCYPVLLPGESHGKRSLVGYSPWGCKESDTTEQLTLSQTVKNLPAMQETRV